MSKCGAMDRCWGITINDPRGRGAGADDLFHFEIGHGMSACLHVPSFHVCAQLAKPGDALRGLLEPFRAGFDRYYP